MKERRYTLVRPLATLFGQSSAPPPDASFGSFRVRVAIARRVGKAGDSYNRANDPYDQQHAGQPQREDESLHCDYPRYWYRRAWIGRSRAAR
jgi:hypothetical protein